MTMEEEKKLMASDENGRHTYILSAQCLLSWD
jgi:hypothetical protein